MKNIYITSNQEETQNLAKNFAKKVKPGETIFLYGNLGAGKTTFTQGFAHSFGIQRNVISPTFIIIRTYKTNRKDGIQTLNHIDLYRTETEKDRENLGLSEIFSDKYAINIVEWSEKLGEELPEKRWEIHLKQQGKNKREIIIEKFN